METNGGQRRHPPGCSDCCWVLLVWDPCGLVVLAHMLAFGQMWRSSWRVRRTGCGPTPSTRAPASSRELPTRYDSTPPFPPHLRPSTRSPNFHKPSSPPTRYPTFYTLSPTMSYSTFYTTFTPPFTHHLSLLTPSSKVSDSES